KEKRGQAPFSLERGACPRFLADHDRRLHALLDLLVQLVELRLQIPGVVTFEVADIDCLRGLQIERLVVNRQLAV
ncbi:MAG: hypothetical protein WBQ30_10010, partial [Thermoanaerobaculia bacterium]